MGNRPRHAVILHGDARPLKSLHSPGAVSVDLKNRPSIIIPPQKKRRSERTSDSTHAMPLPLTAADPSAEAVDAPPSVAAVVPTATTPPPPLPVPLKISHDLELLLRPLLLLLLAALLAVLLSGDDADTDLAFEAWLRFSDDLDTRPPLRFSDDLYLCWRLEGGTRRTPPAPPPLPWSKDPAISSCSHLDGQG